MLDTRCLILLAFGSALLVPTRASAAADLYEVGVEKLNVRATPDQKGAKVDSVTQKQEVVFLGEVSPHRTTLTLREPDQIVPNSFHEWTATTPWLRIRTPSGKEGWVFAGALLPPKLKAESPKASKFYKGEVYIYGWSSEDRFLAFSYKDNMDPVGSCPAHFVIVNLDSSTVVLEKSVGGCGPHHALRHWDQIEKWMSKYSIERAWKKTTVEMPMASGKGDAQLFVKKAGNTNQKTMGAKFNVEIRMGTLRRSIATVPLKCEENLAPRLLGVVAGPGHSKLAAFYHSALEFNAYEGYFDSPVCYYLVGFENPSSKP